VPQLMAICRWKTNEKMKWWRNKEEVNIDELRLAFTTLKRLLHILSIYMSTGRGDDLVFCGFLCDAFHNWPASVVREGYSSLSSEQKRDIKIPEYVLRRRDYEDSLKIITGRKYEGLFQFWSKNSGIVYDEISDDIFSSRYLLLTWFFDVMHEFLIYSRNMLLGNASKFEGKFMLSNASSESINAINLFIMALIPLTYSLRYSLQFEKLRHDAIDSFFAVCPPSEVPNFKSLLALAID